MRGAFITFEGVEGCGKTTQLRLLEEHLRKQGHRLVVTREPGGPPIAEAIREILLNPAHTAMGNMTELLLYTAARAQHVYEVIWPALELGQTVLCDRFADSTAAYQGAGRGIPVETLGRLHQMACGGLQPDLTILLDLSPEEGLTRARGRGRADRLEQESVQFHHRVREGFLELAHQAPDRIVLLAGSAPIEHLAAQIRKRVEALLPPPDSD
ncbi:MAG: dTMP kinase [Candidatus Hydrogenedentes bacterium]|nr:dTMP kinase [Candidatus Hydrogenedentota bacterium]MBI3119078.1 dTMP kinase [Candidatus Hydrogenedentota bacterium]